MWLKRLTHYLLNNLLQTTVIAFVITFVPVLQVIGILLAALVTLRRGVLEGAAVTFAATLPYLASFAFETAHQGAVTTPTMLWTIVGIGIASNVMTYVFAVMVRYKVSLSNILQIGALFGAFVVSVVHFLYPDIASWWGGELQAAFVQTEAAAQGVKASTIELSAMQINAIDVAKNYATGMLVLGVLFNAVIQLLIARMWSAAVYLPSAGVRAFWHIRLSSTAGILFVLSVIALYIGNDLVLDIVPVLYGLFCVAGLSLIHYVFGHMMTTTARFIWIIILYVAVVFTMPVSILLLAMIALADIWLDVRKYLTNSLDK